MDDAERAWKARPRSRTHLRNLSVTQLKVEICKVRNVVLLLLIVQTTSIVLLMRYSRTVVREPGTGPAYKASVAVFMAEVAHVSNPTPRQDLCCIELGVVVASKLQPFLPHRRSNCPFAWR